MKRRGYISAVSLTAASISSGCASILDSPTVQLGGVVAANYTDETLEIEISVREDGTTHQHSTVDLPPASESERDFTR
jgi:uncharacterized protein YceK